MGLVPLFQYVLTVAPSRPLAPSSVPITVDSIDKEFCQRVWRTGEDVRMSDDPKEENTPAPTVELKPTTVLNTNQFFPPSADTRYSFTAQFLWSSAIFARRCA